MPSILAIAPNGGAAFTSDVPFPREIPPGHRHEPHGDVTHWTPRRPTPTSTVTNCTLEETPAETDWIPVPKERLTAALIPRQVVRLDHSSQSLAERIASLPADQPYVMAIAAASMILRNTTNGVAHAAFPDGSHAYLIAGTMEVRPTSS